VVEARLHGGMPLAYQRAAHISMKSNGNRGNAKAAGGSVAPCGNNGVWRM